MPPIHKILCAVFTENDDDIIHLKGGIGVFGAIAYDEVTFLAK